jgi:rubredoxin
MTDEANKREAARLVEQGAVALKNRDVKLARKILLAARKLDPTNIDALLWLTSTTSDPAHRRSLLEEVLRIDPDHAGARQALDQLGARSGSDEGEVEPTGESQESAEPAEATSLGDLPEAALPVETVAPVVEPPAAPSVAAPQPETALPQPSVGEMAPPEAAHVEDTAAHADDAAAHQRCPRCGAVLRIDERSAAAVCVFCGYGMTGQLGEQDRARAVDGETAWPEIRQARRCLTCEAYVIYPAGRPVESTPCPLCQQSISEPVDLPYSLPGGCFPFKLSEAEAAIALEDAVRGGVRRLFGGRTDMTRPRRVYLPVWVFQGTGVIEYEFRGKNGVFKETYPAVPVHGVPQIDGRLLRVASNLELGEARPYTSAQGREVFVLLPNHSLQASVRDVRSLILDDVRRKALAKAAAAVARQREAVAEPVFKPGEVRDLAYRLILLPLWVNDVREGGRMRMGLVNALTGEVALGEPVRRQRGR